MPIFRCRIDLGKESTVVRSPPRIRIRVALGLALPLKASAIEVSLPDESDDDTHTRLLRFPTCRLTTRMIEPLMARVPVLGQSVSIETAGGVTCGHRLTGRPTIDTILTSTIKTVTIYVKTG